MNHPQSSSRGRQAHHVASLDDLRAFADRRRSCDVVGMAVVFQLARQTVHPSMVDYRPSGMALALDSNDVPILLVPCTVLTDATAQQLMSRIFDTGPTAVHGLSMLAWFLDRLHVRLPLHVDCTHLMAMLVDLGRYNPGYDGVTDDIDAMVQRHSRQRELPCTLQHLVTRHGLKMEMPAAMDHMGHLCDQVVVGPRPNWMQVNQDLCARAVATARLHTPLYAAMDANGVADHYENVELPAAHALASIEVAGVTIGRSAVRDALRACHEAVPVLRQQLMDIGIAAPDDDALCRAALQRNGLDVTGPLTFDILRDLARVDPNAALLWRYRRFHSAAQRVLEKCLHVDARGRLHPFLSPLGADTGRVTSSVPNLMGLDRVLRPVVVPDGSEYGIAELDFAQQEASIAGEVYDDPQLIADCNAGDVYALGAREVVGPRLGLDLTGIGDSDIKALHGKVRDRMKLLFLSMLNGVGIDTVARWMRLDRAGAEVLVRGFRERYPDLQRNMQRQVALVARLGYAASVTGLRRHRAAGGPMSPWETRWARNTPIQSGAASVLKITLGRLHGLLPPLDARVLLPVHDSVVLHYPLSNPGVIEQVREVMVATFCELYPRIRPRVEVTASDPTCWNRAGLGDSIQRFLEDPFFTC